MSTDKIIQRMQGLSANRKIKLHEEESPEKLPSFLQKSEPEESVEVTEDNIWEEADRLGADAPQDFQAKARDIVEELMDEGKINELVDGSDTPLTIAVSSNLPYLFDVVLKAGADPNIPNAHKDYPLTLSGQVTNFYMTEKLIQAGAVLGQKDSEGKNLLLIALEQKDPEYLDDVCSNYPGLVRETYLSPLYDDAKELGKWEITYQDKAGKTQKMVAIKYLEMVVDAIKEEHQEALTSLKGTKITKGDLISLTLEWYTGKEPLTRLKNDLAELNLKLVKISDEEWEVVPNKEVAPKKDIKPSDVKPRLEPLDLGTSQEEEPVEISVEVPIEDEEDETSPETPEEEPESQEEAPTASEEEEPKQAKPKSKKKPAEKPQNYDEVEVPDDVVDAFVEARDEFTVGSEMPGKDWVNIIVQLFPGKTFDDKIAEFNTAMGRQGRKLVSIPGSKNMKVIKVKSTETKKLPYRIIGK